MAPFRTYSHLRHLKQKPSEYEIVTSQLLYYPQRGFEAHVPLSQWYERYQQGSLLTCKNWENFHDPRETTYTKYTALQKNRETFLDGIFQFIDHTHYDQGLSPSWLETLTLMMAPLRYPWHGLQMISSYIGQMAPSGRIVIASMFQSADEMRRVQRMAYRLRQLQMTDPSFGEESKFIWEKEPMWQPLRELIEKLLITYDWGEAFIALNGVVKPLLDSLFLNHLSDLAKKSGDSLLGEIFYSFKEDCLWHQQWSQELIQMILQDSPENASVIECWTQKWYPLTLRSVTPLAQFIDQISGACSNSETQISTLSKLENEFQGHLSHFKNNTKTLKLAQWR